MTELPDFADWLLKKPHRPPNVQKSADSVDSLLRAIGALTVTWETTETLLAFMFQRFCKSDAAATLRAYGSIVGSGARCDMLKAAAEAYYGTGSEGFRTTNRLIDITRRLAACRNVVAHSMIYANDATNVLNSVDVRFPAEAGGPLLLTPASYNAAKTGMLMAPRIGWDSEAIDLIREQVNLLSVHIHQVLFPDIDRGVDTRFRFAITIASESASAAADRADNIEQSK